MNEEPNKQTVDTEEYIGKPLGFFKKVFYSITKFEKYPEMAAQGVGKAFKYLLQIMLVFTTILCIAMVIQLYTTTQRGIEYIQNSFPDILYKDGNLSIESKDPIIIEDSNSVLGKIVIDTNTQDENEINKYIQSIGQEESGLILLKDKVIVKNKTLANSITYQYKDAIQSFSNGQLTEFTKQDIINFANSSNMISFYIAFFLVMLMYLFVIYLLATIVDAFVLSVLGYITTMFARLRIKYSAIYNMAVYSLTLSILLNAIYIVVNTFTGFEITYFQVMYTSVAYIYLVAAIFIIKSDFIKKQIELMKIIEEQQKVKEELKDIEREDKKKEKPEDNKEEKDDEKEEDKGTDGEPEGSNA